jgi:hypothetical protein
MRIWPASLIAAGLWSLAGAGPALAATDDQLGTIQTAQHNFIINNGGDPSLELSIENSLARSQGNANFALIDQVEGTNNQASIRQVGDTNTSAVMQGFGNSNQANIDQEGTGNFASLTQAGTNNAVNQLLQSGNYNSATVTQQGFMNTALISQYNNNNELSLSQTNSYNNATVDQYGNTNLDITQNNPGGSASSENNLLVKAYTEAGASNMFQPISLSGAGNTKLYLCNGSASYCSQVLAQSP